MSSGASTEAQTAMGEDFPVGFVHKPGADTITLSILQEKGEPEVDWEYLAETKEVVSITRELVGGRRTQYPFCVVSKADPDDDDEGKHTLEVELISLQRKRL